MQATVGINIKRCAGAFGVGFRGTVRMGIAVGHRICDTVREGVRYPFAFALLEREDILVQKREGSI